MDKEELKRILEKLYRLTLLFPKKEPLRYKIREIAIEIFSQVYGSKASFNPLIEKLDLLIDFLNFAKSQNWVKNSKINEVIEGYEKIREELKERNNIMKLNFRQEKILDILKEKKRVQVGDLKEIFPNLSKRTIRRDLVQLVKLGYVLRTGEVSTTFYQLKNGE